MFLLFYIYPSINQYNIIMKNHFFLFAISILFFASCSHTYYAPNTVNTPHLMGKNNLEVKANAVFPVGQSSDFNAFEASATYSPIKYLAVQGNYFYGYASGDAGTNNGKIYDIAIGGYLPKNIIPTNLDPSKREELSLSGFVGTSFGNIYNTYDTIGKINSRLKFQKTYFTFSTSYLVQKFKLGFGMRINYLSYLNGSVTNGSIQSEEISKIVNIEEKSNFFYPEMSINLGLDFKKVYVTWGLTRAYFKDPSLYNFNNSNVYLSLGFNIHEFFKKRS